ncbi:MAG: bifunctional 2-C-methyl-D-erythritol 4-phosphate cytidylyltransferase/2-C-methyl-D-erythritol 2,4-cyclodiphosphate synthase [Rhodospirillaceae bacterium]|jgi:2-C-methyl-D-erythritol 4-phosphate cytidylyltransferase / 2-C-methyl-D-erythritol 2,4-cyclodiphosphate synthase|nr:bifunctional 2-C-methyl-D-erythritol 4-phosphate cytidylyltransferase/2-C-methyl-D-erythritol 2,4-cyclodiphosphate synthase [Rhodospirillaceae bacterium]
MNSQQDTSPDCIALIVSAGRGHRFGGEIPKQYLEIAGQSLLVHTAGALLSHPRLAAVRAVIHPDDEDLYRESIDGLSLLEPVYGGVERQDSVRLGLESLEELTPKHILIHDSVRPFIDHDTIDRLLTALENGAKAAIPGVPVADTLKRSAAKVVQDTVDRTDLWRAQTPQAFDFKSILAAHQALAGQNLTDDAAIAEANGISVEIVQGSEDNFKITTTEDMARAEKYLGTTGSGSNRVTRVGTGFDVHKFTSGSAVILGGIEIPHDLSLAGHSDADVALHALTDALLGAVGAGDIGLFFPPSDPQWQGVASEIFLARAGKEISDRGGRIENVDLTIICETPKIGPHREKMQQNIANILNLTTEQVNVKGTTTEQLGFTGRGEGIAAQAAASVSFST